MGSSTSRLKLRRHQLPSIATAYPSATPSIGPSSHALPSELLLIVFDLAHETVTLSALRVVSMQFNRLLVPIIYHKITLSARVVACFQQSDSERSAVQLNIAKNICRYTRHVTIDKELHWSLGLQLLYVLENLRELTLSYWPVSPDTGEFIAYSTFAFSSFRERWPGLRLAVERHDASTTLPFYTLLTNAVSYKTTVCSQPSETLNLIMAAMLKNPQLETLHLLGNKQELKDVKWKKWDRRRLPPVKELVIRDLLGWDTLSICDWSNITYLELTNVSNVALTEGLPPGELSRLKTLIIACECWDRAERQNQLQKLSDFLNSLLGYTSDLEKLALKCGVCDFHQYRRGASLTIRLKESRKPNDCIPAIAQHCQGLRSLDLHNFDGPRSLPWKWILLSANDLEVVRCSCPGLMELSLDAKVYLYDRQPRLDVAITAALATLRNLRRLTVYTLMPYLPPEAGLLPHHQARAVAREWIENLQRLKEGALFEKLTMNIEIERLVVDDEYQRINEDDDWRVFLTYTCEAEKGVSWSVTGEDRSLEFIRR